MGPRKVGVILDLFSVGVLAHLPSPGGGCGEDAASKMWRWVGGRGAVQEERPRGDYRLPTYQIGPEAGHPWVTRQKPPSRSGLCFLIPSPLAASSFCRLQFL